MLQMVALALGKRTGAVTINVTAYGGLSVNATRLTLDRSGAAVALKVSAAAGLAPRPCLLRLASEDSGVLPARRWIRVVNATAYEE